MERIHLCFGNSSSPSSPPPLRYVRDCDISFITSWAIPRIRNIAVGKKQYQASTTKSGNNRRAKGRTNALSMRAFFRGYGTAGGSTVLLLPHCCYWKGDTASAEVLQHNAEVEGGSEYARGITRGFDPFSFLFRKANLLSERRTISTQSTCALNIHLSLAHLPRCIMPPSPAPLEMKSSMEECILHCSCKLWKQQSHIPSLGKESKGRMIGVALRGFFLNSLFLYA